MARKITDAGKRAPLAGLKGPPSKVANPPQAHSSAKSDAAARHNATAAGLYYARKDNRTKRST
jgi:hypothetical protein